MDDDCDTLAKAGYELERDGRPLSNSDIVNSGRSNQDYTCGNGARVVSEENVEDPIVGVSIGFECKFTRC